MTNPSDLIKRHRGAMETGPMLPYGANKTRAQEEPPVGPGVKPSVKKASPMPIMPTMGGGGPQQAALPMPAAPQGLPAPLPQGPPAPEQSGMIDQVITLLRQDVLRSYRIDIETDSTIRGDLTRNQTAMAQFVSGTAQFFQAIAPAVEAGAIGMEAAVTVYSAFARNFKLGKQVDDTLDKLIEDAAKMAQQPKPPDPNAAKLEMEIQKMQAEIKMQGEKHQMDMQAMQAELQGKQQGLQMDLQGKQADLQLKGAELQMKHESMQMQQHSDMQGHMIDMQGKKMDLQAQAMTTEQNLRANEMKARQQQQILAQKAKQGAQRPKGDRP